MKQIYLAGPINGRSDVECKAWRQWLKDNIADFAFIDPMRRDYRSIEIGNEAEIVEGDKDDIDNAAAVVAMVNPVSAGTSMEIMYAHTIGTAVIAICGDGPVSPWVIYHSAKRVYSVREVNSALIELLGR